MDYKFSRIIKSTGGGNRGNYRSSSGSYSSGAGYSVATGTHSEKISSRTVLLEKEGDGDVDKYPNDQQDGAWGGSSRHVTIREEGDSEKSPQDLESVKVISPNEECAHCVDDTERIDQSASLLPSEFPVCKCLRTHPFSSSIYSLDLPTIMSDQNEFALYPRFGKLNCLNLLHLQQHLFDLEQQLEDLNLEELKSIEEEDFIDNMRDALEGTETHGVRHRQQSRVSRASYSSNLSTRSAGGANKGPANKFEKVPVDGRSGGDIRGLYASTRDRRALKVWLQRADDPLARNSDSLRFLDEDSADVIALCARDSDILENFFQSRLLRILENWSIWAFVFPSIRGAVATIKPTIQSRATLEFLRFFISLGGAVLIVAPVVVLYFTRSEWASDKKEVLMATTGYTAVLVVFVGSDAFSDATAPMPG
ncbi:hypothetical protein P167DRAFT_547395 [Morchella conica CCBAS932]|uniref:DUF6594 domain-containing protein n=1 Tax=Morchella conica CCBAS932 TaxID=1392247 RepID=A0A3N4KWZ3_9PEZI|nr:hypothetical protein P167DRAFT_547395 [Morchella conica CCBAS932]